ncbi:hypothetical protein L596_013533 [Steinernema carpocapsae]|uniref:Uncharacterized protein n=1 Tax=Steinernema carpocapsae TaxID=34508 RepID=A0A4U5P0H6_STECR|nr:hypothetical protein L596_013533 [Steinernema carpocapsae]
MTLSQPNPEAPYGKLEDGELEESDAEIHEAAKETEQGSVQLQHQRHMNQITGRGRTPSPPPRPKIPQGYVAQSHRKLIGDDFHQPRDEFKAAVSRQGPEVASLRIFPISARLL